MTRTHRLPTEFRVPAEASGFGGRLRALRAAAGLTQAELAEKSGISERTISDLERGMRSTAYPSTARRLAAALGIAAMDSAPSEQRSRLPMPLTRLLGRQTELVMVRDLLSDREARLLTIIGSGGIGKTRLAIEAAMISHKEFPEGVFFVNLSATDDPAMVLPVLAGAIGLGHAGTDLVPALNERLGDRRALVVLDTFEHLQAAAVDVGALVAACPSLTVVSTSRAALRVRGEREVPLRPLSVAAGVELFIERARAVAPNFTGSGPALGLVQEICNRLDGIPLAIELAAARVRHLPLRELLGQLENTLAALVGGARDLPDRQRTMRAALDWSYELLDGDQRRRFRALAPFRGGFDLKAAAAPIAALGELVDASLVLAETNASGASRFRLLDVTREYATERAAAAGELDGLTRRHATHFLELAEEAEPELRGARQRAAYTRLLDDEGNFRVALGWALEAGEADIALRLAGALWMFWRWAGLFIEGRAWLEAALAAGDESSLEIRCQGLWGAGWLAYHRGDYGRTAELGARMLELLEGEVSPVLRRNALTLVGNAALAQGRSRDALSALEDALHLCEPMGASWHLATSQLNHGTALLNANRLSEAQTAFERALVIYEARGDQHFAARTRIQLAYTALESGDTSGARRHAAEAMRTVAEARDAWGIAEGLEAVAAVGAADAPRESVVLAGAAQRLRDRIGMLPHPQDAILNQRQLEAARRQIADFDLAFAEGQATAIDEAIRLAGEALEAGSS